MRHIEVFRAFNKGKLQQIGLSADQIHRLCPESINTSWKIEVTSESVAEAVGIVHRWPSGKDHVHWQCLLCGQQHISDLDQHTISNPVLWFCELGDGGICLVQWK